MKTINPSGSNSMSRRHRRRLGLAAWGPAAALALAFTGSAPAENQSAPVPFSEIGARATANYQGDALAVVATAEGARLRCGFQKLEGRATAEGLWLESTAAGGGRVRLVAASVRREGTADGSRGGCGPLSGSGTVSVEDKLVRFARAGLTEEYSVSVDGVRQDFVIAERPAGSGDLRVELALSGAGAEAAAYGVKLTLEGSGRALAYSRLRVEDATGRELTARLEVLSASRLAVWVADVAAAYPVRIDPTFSDADWVSLNPGVPGANGYVRAMAVDGSGNVYIGGEFTCIGTVVANRVAKWDGSAWSALGSGMNSFVYALAVSGTDLYAGGIFTTAGGAGANYIAKWDGSTWSALGSGMNSYVYALAVSGTNLYAGGGFTTAGGAGANRIARWDGGAWSALGSGMGGGTYPYVYALAVSGADLYAGGPFTTAGGVTVNYVAKWNGSAWSALGTGMGGGVVYALAWSGGNLYAGGWFTTAGGVTVNCIAKWNGSAWSALGSGVGGGVYALAVSATDLYAGGDANYVAKWNGSAWSALSSGMGGSLYALAWSGGNLYAGGSFTMAGGVPANHIAKWDGSVWSALGSVSGMDGSVYALAVSGTNLYAGGSFTNAVGVPANRIAKWNGSAWSALGSGMNSFVYALAVSGTNLYAGGIFTTAGGAPATNIAKWDGSAWSALGSGMDGSVQALVVNSTNLYAGGSFFAAGGVTANGIAMWDGSVWSPLGSGMGGGYPYVSALAVSGTDLYAGGGFTSAGGVANTKYIAKWNGNAWSALGSGVDGQYYGGVSALVVSGTGLYAGGTFTTAGGVPATNIAKWDGSAWSALGSGVGGEYGAVSALAMSGTNLYAGGQFTTAGGVPAINIAKWDGSAWSALGSGTDGGVNALAADGAGHLFVGGQFYLAGTNVSPFIAQANIGATTAQAYTLTANASAGGSVTKSPDQPSYAAGTQVTVTAVPSAGYLFATWWGDMFSTNNPLVVTMNSNITVNANFALIAPIQDYAIRFDTASDTTSWTVWWGPPNPTLSWDGTTDAGGNPSSGSLRVSEAFTGAAGEQFMVFGTLANRWPWDNGLALDCTYYTNLVLDLRVAPGTHPTLNNDYGLLELALVDIDWNWFDLGTFRIPLSATNWTQVVQPINPTLPGLNRVTGIALKMWSDGAFTDTLTFWVDNLSLQVTPLIKLARGDVWQQRASGTPPAGRLACTAVWTGSEMIVWGGEALSGPPDYTFTCFNDGARYNPAANSWATVTTNGAPSARQSHTAVWTGSQMIVWGGQDTNFGNALNDGGRYNPAANTWTAVTTNGAPPARVGPTAVWTGSQMIVWGGQDTSGNVFNDGGRYHPADNTWTGMTTNGAPAARVGRTAVWTGSQMIVWGGQDTSGDHVFNDGGRYHPATDTWTAVTTNSAPAARVGHTAVWTGSEMIVWAGCDNHVAFNDGGRYNAAANTWTAVPTSGAPAARVGHTALWTGSEMIVWGGSTNSGPPDYILTPFNNGGRYNPAANRWTALTTNGAPAGRFGCMAVWTGSELILWGGYNNAYLSDTWSYYPYAAPLRIFLSSPTSAVVAWPVWSTTLMLWQCPDLGTNHWTIVTNAVNQVGSENQVTLSPLTGKQFFLLCYP